MGNDQEEHPEITKAKAALAEAEKAMKDYEKEKMRLEEGAKQSGVKGIRFKHELAQLGASPLMEKINKTLLVLSSPSPPPPTFLSHPLPNSLLFLLFCTYATFRLACDATASPLLPLCALRLASLVGAKLQARRQLGPKTTYVRPRGPSGG